MKTNRRVILALSLFLLLLLPAGVGAVQAAAGGETTLIDEGAPFPCGETGQELPGAGAPLSGLASTPGMGLTAEPWKNIPDDHQFPRIVPRGDGHFIIDWGYDCGCQEEPWEKHAGPLGTAAISLIAAVAAALGASLGSAGGAAAGAVAEALGAAFPEAGAPDAPEAPSEKDEPAEEPAGDYMLPPEAGFGGPAENPYTSFLSGKGPGDCVSYGLPRYWVNTASLNLVIGDTFFESRGLGPEINLTLSYNSASEGSGIFGRGWSFSYEWLLEQKDAQVWVHQGSGQSLPFTTAAGATPEQPVEARAPAGIFHRLIDYGDHWLYIEKGAPLYRRFDRVPGMNLGRLTAVSDYYGNSVRLAYSSRGNLETLTDAAGRMIRFTFNEKNLCTGFALPDGRNASCGYDEQGRLVRTEDLMGIPVDYEYNTASALTKMVTGKSARTVAFTYRQVGSERLLRSFSDPNGNVTCYELLSASPRRVAVTDPEGNITIFQSQGGLTEQVSDPLGRAAAVEYRGGLPVSHRDRNGGEISWEYDGAGNQIKEIDQAGEALTFSYDHFGNLTGITDPLGGRWAYRYNDRHSLVGITSPAGRASSIDYNEQGLPVLLSGFGGQKIRYEYDRF
ncbi:MAG: RHS repeat protein, partial [Firmicutes bacterium]|nr:RHS repeat protein [Bacillota bacterium]